MQFALGLLGIACSARSGAEAVPVEGTRLVSLGGAQDMGRFRRVVEEGEVPALSSLGEQGFFAEHASGLPEADCGARICFHPMLAVAPRFDGSNWTMAYVGMNTAFDLNAAARRPAHVIIAFESTARTRSPALEEGLRALVGELEEDDHVSLVAFGNRPERLLHFVSARDAESALAFPASRYASVDLYAGLAEASTLAEETPDEIDARVVLVASGVADAGIIEPSRIVGLGEGMVRAGASLSVVTHGAPADAPILRSLGAIGAGTESYAESASDLVEVLRREGSTTLVALAEDLSIRVEPAPGYAVGRVYGSERATTYSDAAELTVPAVLAGRRAGAASEAGRRGGGGGLFVELLPIPDAPLEPGAPAFTLSAHYRTPEGRAESATRTIFNALAPGENPEAMWPSFSDPLRGNLFMMLNMYLSFRTTLRFYEAGDCDRSLGVVDMVTPAADAWLSRSPSDDLWADYDLLQQLRANIETSCAAQQTPTPTPPASFHGSCFAI